MSINSITSRTAAAVIRRTIPITKPSRPSQAPSPRATATSTRDSGRRDLSSLTQPTLQRPQSLLSQTYHRTSTSSTPHHDAQPLRHKTTTTPSHPLNPPHPPPTTTATTDTHYSFFPNTLPHGPPPNGPFTLNPRTLRAEFLHLQASAHPDRHPASSKARAEALSARINEAYNTLLDPLARAVYVLSLRGVDAADEGGKMGDGAGTGAGEGEGDMATLAVVMEAREEIEEARRERDLAVLKEDNEARIRGSVEAVGRFLEGGRWEEARREAVRLRFWYGIREAVGRWAEGGGRAMLAH